MTLSKVMVTGASGFIGGYVVDRLLRDGHQVLAFDHSKPPEDLYGRAGVTQFLGDIRESVAVNEAMAHCSGFIHLAGVLGTQETINNPTPAVMTNITGGLNILEAAAQYKVPGINIAVGNHWEQNPYSISKSTVERLAEMYRLYREVQVSTVRALNAYGPRQSVSRPFGNSNVRKIVPSFVARTLHDMPIEIYGNGKQVMDMIYVSDVADFLVDSLYKVDREGAYSTIVEAGTGKATTVLDVANAVIEAAGRGSIEHLDLRPGETPGAVVKAEPLTHQWLYPDGKKLVDLNVGILRTVEYYRDLFDRQRPW